MKQRHFIDTHKGATAPMIIILIWYFHQWEIIQTLIIYGRRNIENMIYMNEINISNVNMSIKLFEMIDSNAKPNIQQSDFLKDFKPFSDGTNKFEIYLQNTIFARNNWCNNILL